MNRREILFRGKRVDNGEWVEGNLTINEAAKAHRIVVGFGLTGDMEGECHVCFGEFHLVDPSTIGQFTGLTDKNGAKIWEEDVVNVLSTSWEYEVKFQKGCFKLVHIGKNAGLGVWGAIYRIEEKGFEIEVIGTIHDTHLTKQS